MYATGVSVESRYLKDYKKLVKGKEGDKKPVSMVKQCYEGHCVHSVWPRGTMVGLGEGAGRMCMMTGVVGRCRNTGGQVGTGKTK